MLGGKEKRMDHKGFSLIEILIVIAVSAILMAVTVHLGKAQLQAIKYQRTFKEVSGLATAGYLRTQREGGIAPAGFADLVSVYSRNMTKNVFGLNNGLTNADDKLITVETVLPGTPNPAAILSMAVPYRIYSSRPITYGVADEVRYDRQLLFGE